MYFQVFDLFASYSEKLAPLGSTQGNESVNNAISVLAPKRIHFSGSESLVTRVGMAVATKNNGYEIISEV